MLSTSPRPRPVPLKISSTTEALSSPLSPPSFKFRRSRSTITTSAYAAPEKERTATATSLPSPRQTSVSPSSFYEVLGIPMGASAEEIKSAYRRLARVCHPDVATTKDTSADEFIKVHAAYSTLSDPDKRADYDRRIFRRHRSFNMSSQGVGYYSGYTRRNWETDQCW